MEIKRKNGDLITKDKDLNVKKLAEDNKADLSGADLSGANLSGANLSGAEIEFHVFPSIRTLSSIQLGTISETLAIELMRRDAWAHPHPERFQTWAEYGDCPYNGEEYFWHFDYKSAQKYWKPGNPEMRDSDLILAICKEKGWKIKGY